MEIKKKTKNPPKTYLFSLRSAQTWNFTLLSGGRGATAPGWEQKQKALHA